MQVEEAAAVERQGAHAPLAQTASHAASAGREHHLANLSIKLDFDWYHAAGTCPAIWLGRPKLAARSLGGASADARARHLALGREKEYRIPTRQGRNA